MTRIAVAGATGRVGRHIVDVLHEGGHEVVAISRSNGVDVITGDGLAPALEGVETVIDVTTGPSPEQGPATEFFTTAIRNLQEAGEKAGVQKLVVVSIIGVDQAVAGYGAAKLAHEPGRAARGQAQRPSEDRGGQPPGGSGRRARRKRRPAARPPRHAGRPDLRRVAPLAARFMIMGSSGQIAPISAHDHGFGITPVAVTRSVASRHDVRTALPSEKADTTRPWSSYRGATSR